MGWASAQRLAAGDGARAHGARGWAAAQVAVLTALHPAMELGAAQEGAEPPWGATVELPGL